MRLVITQYIDAEPGDIAGKLEDAVAHGIDAAASRVATERSDIRTEHVTTGIRICGGMPMLDGGELRVGGRDRLTTLEFALPWAPADGSGARYRAANAFARTVADAVAATPAA